MSGPPTAYERLRRQVLAQLDADRIDPASQPDRVRTLVGRMVAEYQQSAEIGSDPRLRDTREMARRLLAAVTAYGPLTDILSRPEVEEVFIEGARVTYMDRSGRLHGLEAPTTEEENRAVVDRLLAPTNRGVDTRNPIVQARVLDGDARLSVAIPPVAEALSATIRRHSRKRHSLDGLVATDALSEGAAGLLRTVMQGWSSVLVSGQPGAGKTSFLTALLGTVPPGRCVRVCEEIRELTVPLTHGSYYETRPPSPSGEAAITLRDLLRFCLERLSQVACMIRGCCEPRSTPASAATRTVHPPGSTARSRTADVVDRAGWTLVDVYTDDDVSAFTGKERPAWTRMLRDAGAGQIDVVVAWHDDRLWRNVVEQQTVFALLAGYGVQHVQVGGRTYDTASADDSFISGIQALVAQKESADKSRRLIRQRQELAAAGKPHVGGRRPFGYERDMVTVRESEAVLIKEMVERYLAGATTNQLARWLNELEVPTVSGKVGTWRNSTIQGLIGGPRIAGLRAHRGDIIGPGTWPAIIDLETHERIRARFGDPRRRQHDTKRSRLLSGLLICGRCGERMSAKRERTLKAGPRAGQVVTAGYYCSTTSSRDGCGRRAIRAPGLEAYVSELVLATIATPAAASTVRPQRSVGDRQSAAALTASLQADQSRLDELAEAFADGAVDRSQLVTGTEKIRARMDATRRQIRRIDRASILTELPADGAAVVALWDSHDVAWRRQVISALIDAIEIGPGVKRPGFQPERITVRWRL